MTPFPGSELPRPGYGYLDLQGPGYSFLGDMLQDAISKPHFPYSVLSRAGTCCEMDRRLPPPPSQEYSRNLRPCLFVWEPIFLVSLLGFRITVETHSWACLRKFNWDRKYDPAWLWATASCWLESHVLNKKGGVSWKAMLIPLRVLTSDAVWSTTLSFCNHYPSPWWTASSNCKPTEALP